MIRRLSIGVAVLAAIVVGIATASVVTTGTAAQQPPTGRDELPSGSVQTGAPVADPHGGPPWAVRIFDGDSSQRCIVAGRTDGEAFGPVDAEGRIHDTGAVASGSCTDPADGPVQVAVERFGDSAGGGPRSVVFGIVDATVTRVEVSAPGVQRGVALDAARTFLVLGDGLWQAGETSVTVTLSDGTTRPYPL